MNVTRTVIIAQARMGSTRLPGKTMMDLGGAPVVDRVLSRCARVEGVQEVVLATTDLPEDDSLVRHVEEGGFRVVRGSSDDVLSRYVLAAETSSADVIVRVTCDCPLIDPGIVADTIQSFASGDGVDYCSNTLVRTFPLGMDTEVFHRAALEKADQEARQQQEREHVTPYIYQHPEAFSLLSVTAPAWAHWPELRLTIDEDVDLELARRIVEGVGPDADLWTILGFVAQNPELVSLNAAVEHRHMDKPQLDA